MLKVFCGSTGLNSILLIVFNNSNYQLLNSFLFCLTLKRLEFSFVMN